MTDSCITNFTQERLIKYPVSTYLYLHLKSRIYLYTVHLIYVLNPLLYRYVDNVNPITAYIPRPKKGSTNFLPFPVAAMGAGQSIGPCAFDKLVYERNVPHILEKIFFSLDYESFKACFSVNETWNKLLLSGAFQKRAKSVFHEEISKDEDDLLHASSTNNVKEVISLLSTGLLTTNVQKRLWNTTPLQIATIKGHKNIVKLLLERGAGHNKPDKFGWCPTALGRNRKTKKCGQNDPRCRRKYS